MAERRLVKVELDADVEKYIRDMDRAAAATARLAASGGGGDATGTRQQTQATRDLSQAQKQAQGTTAALSGEQRKAAESSIRLSQAQNRVTDATERQAKTAKDLAAAQKTGNDDKIAAAKTRHAKATRDLDIASRSLTVTEAKVAESLAAATAAEDDNARSMDRGNRLRRQSSLTFGQIALAAAAIGPGLIPIAGAAGAAGLALGGMGAAGILALVGIKREMEEGTALGQRFASGLDVAKGALDTLSTTAASGVLSGFEQSVGDLSMRMPTLNRLTAQLSSTLGGAAAAAFRGLLNLLTEAGPLMTDTAMGAQRLAEKFEAWSRSDGARQLLEYMRSSLPGVGEMLGELGRAVVHLLQAMAPMGGTTVAAINALATAINAIPVEVLERLIPLAVNAAIAFKAWKGATAGVAALNAALGRTGGVARTASTGMASVGRAGTAAGGGLAFFGKSAGTASRGVNTFVGSAGRAERTGGRLSRGAKIGAAGLIAMGVGAVTAGDQVENFGLSQQTVTDKMSAAKSGALDLGKGFFQVQQAMATDKSYSFAEGLNQIHGAGAGTISTLSGIGTSLGSLVGLGTGAGSSMEGVKTQLKAYGNELGNMVRSGHGEQAAETFRKMAAEANRQGISTERLKSLMPGYTSALKSQAAAQKAAAAYAKTYAGQLDAYGRGMERLGGVNQKFGGSLLAAQGATTGFYGALQQANAAVKENGRGLNLNTQAGLANRAALDNLAGSTVKWAQEQFKATGSMGQANATLAKGRGEYIKTATAMGMPRAEAERLAASLFKLPGKVSTSVEVPGVAGARYELDSMGRTVIRLQGRNISIPVSTPNAKAVANTLTSIGTAVLSTDGKQVRIPTSALGAEGTKAAIKSVDGARVSADGKSVTIPTKALNAAGAKRLIDSVGNSATLANGKKVQIPVNAPNAAGVRKALSGINAAAVTADSKSVTITNSAPLAASTAKKIDNIRGAAVSADRKSVKISTSSPSAPSTVAKIAKITSAAQTADRQSPNISTSTNAPSTGSKLMQATGQAQSLGRQRPRVTASTNAGAVRGQIQAALRAAVNKSHTITTIRRVVGQMTGAGPLGGLFNAQGGPAYPGAPHFNRGGTLGRDYRHGGQVTGPGSRTSDAVRARLTFGAANLSNYEHVWTGNEVARSGGHGTMYAARALARDGRLQHVLAAGVAQGFATGGPASSYVHRKNIPTDLAGMRAWRPPARQTVTVNTADLQSQVSELSRQVMALADRPVQVHAVGEFNGRTLWEATVDADRKYGTRAGGAR